MSLRSMTVQYVGDTLYLPPLEREIKHIIVGEYDVKDWEHFEPERTCHAELNEDRNAITCSECGSTMLLKGWEELHDWTGTTRISTFTTYPHCPNCGRKVVRE